MSELAGKLLTPFVQLLLSIADDKLILGHRNSDWTGLAPILEEDIAFSSLAQDEMAHAAALYELAGTFLEQSPDQLAFGRPPAEYRCASIVELPDEFDWGFAVARRFLCNHFDALRLERLSRTAVTDVAALASRLAAEQAVQIRHIDEWIERLGKGTADARERLNRAFEHLAPHAVMLFEPVVGQADLESSGAYPGDTARMFETWSGTVESLAQEAELNLTVARPSPDAQGGRQGIHTPHLAELLDEMCEVYRVEPNAKW